MCVALRVFDRLLTSVHFPVSLPGRVREREHLMGEKQTFTRLLVLSFDLTDIWKDLWPLTYFFSPLSQTSPIRTSRGADAIIIKCFMWFGFTVAPLREALASAARPNKSMGKYPASRIKYQQQERRASINLVQTHLSLVWGVTGLCSEYQLQFVISNATVNLRCLFSCPSNDRLGSPTTQKHKMTESATFKRI